MNDTRPSIAKLQRRSAGETEFGVIMDTWSVLLEIAAAALIRRDTECSCGAGLGCFPDCSREVAESALLTALAKVKP